MLDGTFHSALLLCQLLKKKQPEVCFIHNVCDPRFFLRGYSNVLQCCSIGLEIDHYRVICAAGMTLNAIGCIQCVNSPVSRGIAVKISPKKWSRNQNQNGSINQPRKYRCRAFCSPQFSLGISENKIKVVNILKIKLKKLQTSETSYHLTSLFLACDGNSQFSMKNHCAWFLVDLLSLCFSCMDNKFNLNAIFLEAF